MKIFFDTEFIEDGRTIDLVSIGMVREDGLRLYAENAECDLGRASDWVRDNVFPRLVGKRAQMTRAKLRGSIVDFVGDKPEFWADYAAYDWVVLCQLFGRMIDLPKGWPMYCNDIRQVIVLGGFKDDELPPAKPGEHNALVDALRVQELHEALVACGGLRE